MRIARQSPEDPLRAELFGIERLEQHAESLAPAQGVMRRSGRGWRLLQRVEHNGRTLRDAHRVIANAIPRGARDHAGGLDHPARR